MNIDSYDVEFLEHDGSPEETISHFLGMSISSDHAKKKRIAIRQYLNAKKEALLTSRKIGEMERTITKADGTVTSQRMLLLSEEDSKDPKRIMALMGFDILQWTLISCEVRRNYWDVSMRLRQGQNEDGRYMPDVPIKKTNHAFSCKLTVKPVQDLLTSDVVKSTFESIEAPKCETARKFKSGNCLIEPSILDFHLGKGMSLDEEVKLYKRTVLTMLSKIESYNLKPEKFVYQIGQDFIQFDGSNKTTTSGTPIDSNCSSWSDVYKCAVDLLIWTAEQFLSIAPVDFYYVPGNHDKTLSYCMALTLDKYYENDSAVSVDAVDFPRKYFGYGPFAVGMSHGRSEGKRIEDTMQQEAPDLYASATYREYHLGDQHHEESYEKGGIIYRRISSITNLDAWHADKAYRAIRKAPMYVWHKSGDKDIIDIIVKM